MVNINEYMGNWFSGEDPKSEENNEDDLTKENLNKGVDDDVSKELIENIGTNPESQATIQDIKNKEIPEMVNDEDTISRNIFHFINELRSEPKKFIPELYELLETYDREKEALVLDNNIIKLPENCEPRDAIKFLRNVSPKNEILWSEKVHLSAIEEIDLLIDGDDKTNLDLLSQNSTIVLSDYSNSEFARTRIFTNFILPPHQTVLCMLLLTEKNRNILFDENIFESAVVCRNVTEYDREVTLFYFLLNNK